MLLQPAAPALSYVHTSLSFGGGRVLLPAFATASREGLLAGQADDVTGLMSWHAPQLLSEMLARRPHLVAGRAVVELGCGCGLLGTVATALHAASVCLTDGAADGAVLALASLNAAAAAAAAGGGCAVSTTALRWGDLASEALALGTLHASVSATAPNSFAASGLRVGVPLPSAPSRRHFDVVLASEVFYLHRASSVGIEEQAAALLACAARLLGGSAGCPHGSSSRGRRGEAEAEAEVPLGTEVAPPPAPSPPEACGVLLLVYAPRYRGMGAAVRAGARAAGCAMTALRREDMQSAEQAASLRFGTTRALAASACGACLEAWMAHEGLRESDAGDEEEHDEAEEDACAVMSGVPVGDTD